jgi:geranylgeranyl reductase
VFDVAIVGAGPAGATAARLLGSHYRVLLVDRRRLDLDPCEAGLIKPCGGLLAPAAQGELARQGLGIPARVCAGPQLFAVRTLDMPAGLEQLYQRFYVNVDREAFDRWLVGLVPHSVEIAFGWSLTGLQRDHTGTLLRFRTAEGGRAGVRARMVVGADGAGSLVRRLAYPAAPSPQTYVALQSVFEGGFADPHYGAVFDDSLTDFYGWTIPKGGELLVGAAFRRGSGALQRFDEFVRRVRASGLQVGATVGRSSAAIFRPSSLIQLCPGAGDVLLVGEAAGFISPSSAEGISYALSSGATLASAFDDGLDGVDARYRTRALPLAMKVCAKGLKSSAIYGTTIRRLVMRSGIGSLGTQRELSGPASVPAVR